MNAGNALESGQSSQQELLVMMHIPYHDFQQKIRELENTLSEYPIYQVTVHIR